MKTFLQADSAEGRPTRLKSDLLSGKHSSQEQNEKTLVQTLEEIIAGLPDEEGTVTLGAVLDLIERDGFLLVCILLTLPFMVPVSIPGVSTVFGLIILLIGFSVLFNTNPPVPKRLLIRLYPTSKLRAALQGGLIWIRRLERLSRPRILALTRGPIMGRLNGFMLVVGALLLMAPFGFVPFSNTLPGLAILFIAVGMLQRDGRCVLLGYITNILTTAYFAFLICGGSVVLYELWQVIAHWLTG